MSILPLYIFYYKHQFLLTYSLIFIQELQYTLGTQVFKLTRQESFSLRYLNAVIPRLVTPDGTIRASLSGADIIPFPRRLKKTLAVSPKAFVKDEPSITHASTKGVQGVMKVLHAGPPEVQKTLAVAGTRVVIIEGPRDSLVQDFTDPEGKVPFLIPFAPECDATQFVPVDDDTINPVSQVFSLFYGGAKGYKERVANRSRSTKQHNKNLAKVSSSSISLKSYDLNKYKFGILFLFVCNDARSRSSVVQEYTTKEPREHNQFSGVVLSHWHRSEQFYSVTRDELVLAQKVFGNNGFGNRKSVVSMGLNAYTGLRGNHVAIGNPV